MVVAIIIVVIIVVAAASASILLLTQSTTQTTTHSSPTSSVVNQTTNIVVGILPTADAVPFLVAIQNGYFAQQGINITVKYMAGGAVIAPAVAQGSVQIGESSTVGLMASDEQGFNFKFIAPMSVTSYPNGTQTTTYVPGVSTHILGVLSSSNISSWKDLVGKTVAVNTLGAITQVALEQALKDNGVNPSLVHIVAVSPPDWLSALEQKRVDAVDFFEPFATQLVIANETSPTVGAFRIIGDEMNIGTMMQSGFFSTTTWINAHPAIVKGFVTALDMGVNAVAANNTLARQVLVSFLHMNSTVAQHVNLYKYPVSPVPYQWLQIQIQLGLTWGLLKNSNDTASELVDTTYFQLSQ